MHPTRKVKVETNSGDDESFDRPGPELESPSTAEAVQACPKPRTDPRSRLGPSHYKLFRDPSFPFMTVNTPISMNRHLHPSNTSTAARFRSLDRALAEKYVQLVMAHRRRVAAAQSHGGAIMRPRCVPSFLYLHFPDFPASVEICDQPQSLFVTATFELPGLKKEEIGVHLTHDGRLTISGNRRPPPFLANTDPAFVVYPVKDIKYGRFERTINVPAGLEVCPLVWLHHMERSEVGALTF